MMPSIIDSFRISDTKAALVELVVAVVYADGQWLRHTEAFERACAAIGYTMDWRNGLLDEAGNVIPSPYP
jgi:hypothetical protein